MSARRWSSQLVHQFSSAHTRRRDSRLAALSRGCQSASAPPAIRLSSGVSPSGSFLLSFPIFFSRAHAGVCTRRLLHVRAFDPTEPRVSTLRVAPLACSVGEMKSAGGIDARSRTRHHGGMSSHRGPVPGLTRSLPLCRSVPSPSTRRLTPSIRASPFVQTPPCLSRGDGPRS